MRIFALISAWILWLFYSLEAISVLGLQIMKSPPIRGHLNPVTWYTHWFAVVALLFTVLSIAIYRFRKKRWFKRTHTIGVGFWLSTVLFYICALTATLSPPVPYNVAGERSVLQWAGPVITIFLWVLGFPRLPAKTQTEGTPSV